MKHLTFMVGDQFCGVELSSVRELLGYMPFTPLNNGNPAIVGTFDLRGRNVRVVDLRIRFGRPVTRTDDTVMIVFESAGELTALIVDHAIGLETVAESSTAGIIHRSLIEARFVTNVVTRNDRPLNLLNLANTLIAPSPMTKAA